MNYSEEEKEAMNELWHFDCCYNKEIKIILNLIQKQDKIIDKMAEQLTTPIHSKEWIIEFYKKEVEKE